MEGERLVRMARRHLVPAVLNLPRSRVARCPCCERLSLIVMVRTPGFRVCVRCRGLPRNWTLAQHVKRLGLPADTAVLELDAESAHRFLLRRLFHTYATSFHVPAVPLGTSRGGASTCQDITRLTFADGSFDLLVSSEVLEHVPDVHAAMAETQRVLRPGGRHVFTVPLRRTTRQRARVVDGGVEHLTEPEHHSDPLTSTGILVFWDLGTADGAEVLSRPGLEVRLIASSELEGFALWEARKLAHADSGLEQPLC